MLSDVTLRISGDLFTHAKQLTQGNTKQSSDELVDVLDQILASAERTDVEGIEVDADGYWLDNDAAMNREMLAYIAMHPNLKKTHLGKHVAIYEGRLIDSDEDYDSLTRRIDAQYPDQFVWISTVENEPIKTLFFRSPRLEQIT